MKKIILLILTVLLSSKCFAFDIVYPKKNNITINAQSTFFIGSSKTPLKINGENVPIHPSGGFAHVVKLNDGTNTFVIQSQDEKKFFTIIKPIIKSTNSLPVKFIQYDTIKSAYVTTEKAPLRSSPVDSGINRMAHLQRNILLNIDGEKGGFYRIILGNNKYGWIAKTNIKLCENFEPAEILGYDFSENENYYKFVFHLNKKVPFDIIEQNPLTLRLFNIKNVSDNIYTKEFPYTTLQGYGGEYIGNDFVWEIRKAQAVNMRKPLKHKIITIDAGHGGSEIGAIGCLGDKEKDINLSIAKLLEKELTKRGAKIIMTRSDDSYIGLQERINIANYNDSEIFISIHGNALPDGADPNANSGVSIYYYYNQAKPLADTILNSMVNELGLNNDKVRQASFAVIRNTNALSILIETAYLINPDDNSRLINPEFQKECAKAIANGLEEYFTKQSENYSDIVR